VSNKVPVFTFTSINESLALRTLATFLYSKSKYIRIGHQLLCALFLFFICTLSYSASASKLDSLSTRQVWLASQFLPGSGQIINKQYWKIPIFYAGMGSMAYFGYQTNIDYQKIKSNLKYSTYSPEDELIVRERLTEYKMQRNVLYASAAAFYIASVADALVVHSKEKHSPVTATVLSVVFPGMGQVYNRKLWKVPIIFGGVASLVYVVDFNQRGYNRFGDAYRSYPNDEFGGTRSQTELQYFRDAYRRNRDLSIISLVGFYLLNIIDANVDAHFFDWDISDDLSLNLEPTLGRGVFATNASPYSNVGFRLNLKF
jgi:hypothetical protein